MIWLITLFLLAVFAWLLLNGLNEKQWVDAHLHDENVASDEGLFASFTTLFEGEEDDKVGNAVSNLKKKSSEASTVIGEKITEARASETAGKLREKTAGIRERVSNEVKREDGIVNKVKHSVTAEDGVVNKLKNNVSSGIDKAGKAVDDKIVNKNK